MNRTDGYYTSGDYWGFIGKGKPGANKDGYMRFENDEAYRDYLRENKEEKV